MKIRVSDASLKIGDTITTNGDGSHTGVVFTGKVHHIGDKCIHVFHPEKRGKWFTKKAQRNGFYGSCAIRKNNTEAWVEKSSEQLKSNKNDKNSNSGVLKIRPKVKIVG